MTQADKGIRDFWSWFRSVAADLAANYNDPSLLNQLDRWVRSFGAIAWEIGPGVSADWALVLSPQGNKELLETTRQLVSAAPEVPRWEFHPAVPPKSGWNLEFDLKISGATIHVDASGWRYILLKFPDGTFDIIIFATHLDELGESARRIALRIVVDGILGEAVRMERIHCVELATADDERRYSQRIGIDRLAEQFRSLLS